MIMVISVTHVCANPASLYPDTMSVQKGYFMHSKKSLFFADVPDFPPSSSSASEHEECTED
jgi:hypothetical protein